MSRLHLEVLSERAREALQPHAASAHAEGFYLAGGTALALQLGHRRSLDFDGFRGAAFEPLALARRGVQDLTRVPTALTDFDDAENDPEPVLEAREDRAEVEATIRARRRERVG